MPGSPTLAASTTHGAIGDVRRPQLEPLDLPVKSISWGAVLYGTMTGFAGALLVFLVLGLAGLENDLTGQSILIFLLYAAFMVAGYVAGRFARANQIVHGGIAAMTLFALQVVVSGASVLAVLFGGVTAAIIGSAGGALGQWTRERTGGSQTGD